MSIAKSYKAKEMTCARISLQQPSHGATNLIGVSCGNILRQSSWSSGKQARSSGCSSISLSQVCAVMGNSANRHMPSSVPRRYWLNPPLHCRPSKQYSIAWRQHTLATESISKVERLLAEAMHNDHTD
jgi:hypothetical protein